MKTLLDRLVIAISGSEASLAAAKYGIVLAKQAGCRLTAVYVIDTATIKQLAMNRIFVPEESEEYERGLEENGKRYLAFADELARAKGVKMETELRKGAIHTEIMACADEREADAILLGGWERSREGRDIISASYREIGANSHCSVIIVKEPLIDQVYKNL